MRKEDFCLARDALQTEKLLAPSAARMVATLDGLPPLLRFGDHRPAKVFAFTLATPGNRLTTSISFPPGDFQGAGHSKSTARE